MRKIVVSIVAFFISFGLSWGETIFVQDGWNWGRSGKYLRLFSITIGKDSGVAVYTVEDGCCGNTILHKELLTVHEDFPIPPF